MTGFHVSFQVRHPERDLTSFLAELGVTPSRSWKAGDRRRTPKDEPLDGTYASSYLCCELPLQDENDLAVWLEQAVEFLRPARSQLVSLADDGGSLSLYIGLEKGRFEGASLKPELLAQLAALRVSLDIDRNL